MEELENEKLNRQLCAVTADEKNIIKCLEERCVYRNDSMYITRQVLYFIYFVFFRTICVDAQKCTSAGVLNANIRVVYVVRRLTRFSRSKLINVVSIKLVQVPSEKPVPQRPDQNEQGQRVKYGLVYIIYKQIAET